MKRNDYFILAFAGIVLAAIFITPADGAQITNAFARIFIDGVNVFNAKSYNDPLEFVSGTGISISPSAPNRITISSTAGPGGDTNTAQIGDAGTHTSIFSSRFNATKNLLKTFVCDGTVSCTTNTTDIRITGASAPASITSINAQTGPAITIQGTSRNVTVASAGNIITLNLGDKAVTYDGTQTLTSKTMDGTLNTFLNIAQASITNLVSDLASKQAKSEKGQSNGYASLNSNTLVPSRELGSGSNTSSTYLRGDRTWATISSTDTNTAQIASAGGVSVWKQRDNATQNILYGLAAVAGNTTLTTGATTITINTGYNTMTTTGSNQTVFHSLNITAGNKLQSTPNSKWASLNIGTLSADPTRLRQGDMWISSSSLEYNDNTNTTRQVEIQSNKAAASGYAPLNSNKLLPNANLATNTNSSSDCLKGDRTWGSCSTGGGYTKINGLLGGNARIVATNTTLSNTQATFKSIANGTGLFVVNGSKTLTFYSNGQETHRWGSFTPTSATTQGDGQLTTSFTLEGTETLVYNTTRGTLSIDTTTGAGGLRIAGVLQNATNFNIFRGDQNSYLYIEAAPFGQTVAGGNRLFIGFQSGQTFQPKNADTIVNAISAFGVCVRTTDTTFQRCENDGAGAGTYTSLGVSTNTNWHTFKIYALNSGTSWCVEIDRQDASCATTDVPASTTRLYLNALATQQPSTTTKTFRYGYIYVQNDR